MRCDLWHLHSVNAVVLLADMLEVFFPVHCHHRASVFIQVQKACLTADHRLQFRFCSVFQNTLEALINIIGHREYPGSRIRLGIFNDVLHSPGALQLMIDIDRPILQVDVLDRQADKFRDSQAGLKQDVNTLIVFCKVLIVLDKF